MNVLFADQEKRAAGQLISLALDEDLNNEGDVTSTILIDEEESAEVNLVARQPGVLAGLPVATMVLQQIDPQISCQMHSGDGSHVSAGAVVATFSGRLRALLTGERTALNFLTHLSGVATLTRQFVERAAGTKATVLDTRKTLPGWRVLEKYAVRCGGGTNHRMGLYDGVLIKDNHLAAWLSSGERRTIADAVLQARLYANSGMSIEVEVDSLEQFQDALRGHPDIVLLDNFSPTDLTQSVKLRDRASADVLLEASGGVTLDNISIIAQTGVDRISVGALTHSAVALDLAFDWEGRARSQGTGSAVNSSP